jgi:hypothetical protein
MLQYSLLLVELLLFGAMAFLYWNTRKLTENAEVPTPLVQPGWPQNQSTVTQMAQDVAQLVTELQAVAGATRDDLMRQRVELQAVLENAETLTEELRSLVDQAEINPVSATQNGQADAPEQPVAEPVPDQSAEQVSLELVYSPTKFGEFLRISGCGHDVVSVASEHAQEFILWFAGQFENEPVPNQIGLEWLDDYITHLETNRIDPDTIQRRFIALKAYVNWANHLTQSHDLGADHMGSIPELVAEDETARDERSMLFQMDVDQFEPEQDEDAAWNERNALLGPAFEAEPNDPPAVVEEQILDGVDRYRTVFSLADQGIDQLTIAAKTGLEQEAVRMMLMMGQSVYAS